MQSHIGRPVATSTPSKSPRIVATKDLLQKECNKKNVSELCVDHQPHQLHAHQPATYQNYCTSSENAYVMTLLTDISCISLNSRPTLSTSSIVNKLDISELSSDREPSLSPIKKNMNVKKLNSITSTFQMAAGTAPQDSTNRRSTCDKQALLQFLLRRRKV